MAMAATEMNKNGDVARLEFKSSPNVSMDGSQEDHSQALDSFDNDTPALTMETSTCAYSSASLHYDNEGESDNDLEEMIEIDENSIPSIIEEICPVDGPCVQCEIEQPCSFRFTDNGETLYVCNEPCIKAYQAEYPGKYTVTRKKYLIEEITPKTLLCSECEEKKTCYFYYNFHGEDTFYCSLNCLEEMMADEKDKYAFKRNSVTICIDKIRPKEGQCLICEQVKPCEFSLVRYGEPRFLCERNCIKILNGRERGRYYIKKLRVSKPAVSNAIDENLDDGYKIQEKTAAMFQREQSFHRRCSQCTLILMIDENVLAWEAMDFCDELCLERFQNGIGSRCAKCNNLVQHTSLGKYCVRFGYDIRQFCDSSCLQEFKKGLKICCYCQRNISASTRILLAPVGDKGQFKDFCAQSCVEKLDQMSKHPVPQPVWAKCAVCSLEKATTIEMEVTETTSQRICSDPCFAAYKFVSNILPDQCKWCKKYFERKSTKSFTTYDDSNPNCFCSQSCMTIHINYTKFLVSCNWCKSQKYNFDMIRRVDNGQAVMMCSLNCLSLYQKSTNALSSSNDFPPPTLAPPAPSIEQGRADMTALAVEQLIPLTKSRKRRETTQSPKQTVHQSNESPKKIRFAIPDSPRSGRKEEARSSRLAVEQLITLTKSRKRRETTQSPKQTVHQSNESPKKVRFAIPDSPRSGRKEETRSSSERRGVRTRGPRPGRVRGRAGGRGVARGGGEGSSGASVPAPGEQSLWTPVLVLERDGRGRGRGAERGRGERRPTAISITRVEDLPQGEPLERALTQKKRRCWRPEAGPSGSPETSPGQSPAPLSVQFMNTTRPNLPPHRSLRETDFVAMVHAGSEEESSDSEDDAVVSAVPVPRVAQLLMETPEDAVHLDEPTPTAPLNINHKLAVNFPRSMYDFEWRLFPDTPIHPELRRETFSAKNCGPTVPSVDPYDIFIAIWDLPFMEYIASETNTYAQQYAESLMIDGSLQPGSRICEWQDTCVGELYTYFAVILAMGVTIRSRLEEYWDSIRDIFSTPGFRSLMSLRRFQLLSKCLHFANSCDLVGRNLDASEAKLFKIQPVLDHLNLKFSNLYKLNQNIALDESLLQWRGWLSINQFIPNKAAHVGIKSYEICESQTGYLWRFEIHAHQRSTAVPAIEDPMSSLTSSLVLRLVQGLENKGHTIWMDNFYNSPALARKLKTLGFDCVGTLRTNRQYVPVELTNLTKSNMRPGELAGYTSGDVDLMVWRDQNRVAMISTYHGNSSSTGADGTSKPILIRDYNVCMGGVDKKDQMLATYPIERKRTRIWYKKLFKRLLNASVLNSYIIHKQTKTDRPLTHRQFRMKLIRTLLDRHSSPSYPQPSTSHFFEVKTHYPAENPFIPSRNGRQRRVCVVCHKRTTTHCVGCGNKPVCAFSCFRLIHL